MLTAPERDGRAPARAKFMRLHLHEPARPPRYSAPVGHPSRTRADRGSRARFAGYPDGDRDRHRHGHQPYLPNWTIGAPVKRSLIAYDH
jgi:hypothetical protein